MVHLKNLSSSECFNGALPWEFISASTIPEDAFKDKVARDAWINSPDTDHHVYTLYEGTQQNLRLRGGAEGNPPLVMHGLAVDYDCAMTSEQVLKALPLMGDRPPTWFEQTLSGNGRVVWMFSEPLKVPNRQFLVKFIESLADLIPYRKLPGLDEPALKAPERYFTNGAQWELISSSKVPLAQLVGHIVKVSNKFDWTAKEFGKAVDMKEVAIECRAKYPRFADWPGELELGAQGPTFWIDGSTSPKSAIVRETGIHTFSGHATKAFYSWAELVGAKFVEDSENKRLGAAVEGVYWDGKLFIIKDGNEKYSFLDKGNLSLLLRTHRGLNNGRKKDGSPNEVEQAIAYVLHHKTVDGAGSCAFYPHGLFQFGSKRILNTHQIEVTQPSEETAVWGPEGAFPFLSKFFDGFFAPVEPQRDRFLAWFQYHYLACKRRAPVSGHGVFIAGPVGCGKTFLNRGIIGGALGGFAEANTYLMATDNFNSELFDYGLWCIDDGSVSTSDKAHQLFSENVKRVIANPQHRVNEKFRKAFMTPWQGRIVVTLNVDPESIRLIPNVDASILEKLMLFRAGERCVDFLPQEAMMALCKKELPHFLRWLVDWTPPGHCYEGAEARFGLTAYHEPTMLRSANLSSGKSVFNELLSRWLGDYFKANSQIECWEGTAIELRIAMMADPAYCELLKSYRPDSFPRMLQVAMAKQIFEMKCVDGDDERVFTICKKVKTAKPKVDEFPVSDAFQKK